MTEAFPPHATLLQLCELELPLLGKERWKWQGGTCEPWLGHVLPAGVKHGVCQRSGRICLKELLVDVGQVFHITMNRIVLY